MIKEMSYRKPWTKITIHFISDKELSQIRRKVSLIGNLIDLNNEQFTLIKSDSNKFDISTLNNADVILIESLPKGKIQLKSILFSFIIKQNIPCWIYKTGFYEFCKYLNLKFIDEPSESLDVTLTETGKKDPVFSIMPDSFQLKKIISVEMPSRKSSKYKPLALVDYKYHAAIKLEDKPVYATAFDPKDHKEILMQFLRTYVGYLEYLA